MLIEPWQPYETMSDESLTRQNMYTWHRECAAISACSHLQLPELAVVSFFTYCRHACTKGWQMVVWRDKHQLLDQIVLSKPRAMEVPFVLSSEEKFNTNNN